MKPQHLSRGGQISRVIHVSTRAAFGVFAEKCGFVQEGHAFIEKVWFRARGAHIYRKSVVSCKRGTHFLKKCGFVQEGHTFIEQVWFRARGAHFYRKHSKSARRKRTAPAVRDAWSSWSPTSHTTGQGEDSSGWNSSWHSWRGRW